MKTEPNQSPEPTPGLICNVGHMKSGWPAGPNLFCEVASDSVLEVAGILGADGWSIRSCGRDEMEAEAEDSELCIHGSSPVLVHGLSRDLEVTASRLALSFGTDKMSFVIELYDASGGLLRKIEGPKVG